MKKLTKQKRKEIYLDAIQYFSEDIDWRKNYFVGFCDFLEIKYGKEYNISDFPEYFLFKPHTSYLYWFETDEQTDRINALLLAIEMTR